MTSHVRTLSLGLVALLAAAAAGACNKEPPESPPLPQLLDLSAYFILPDTGFDKTFDDGTNQSFRKDTTVFGYTVSDLVYADGHHVYYRRPDRAWVATYTPGASTPWFQLEPPLIAPPAEMPLLMEVTANSSIKADSTPVSMMSELLDTGLTVTVKAGTFGRVIRVRQIFRVFRTVLGSPDTILDSSYRWFAPGIDEIRRVQWDTLGDSIIREFQVGTAGS